VSDLFRYTTGPLDARVILIGEAWGAQEAYRQKPFQGQAGELLDKMLFKAGIPRNTVLCTNIMHAQPPGNEYSHFLYPNPTKKKDAPPAFREVYARPELVKGVHELWELIRVVNPELVVAAGNWPLWAVSDKCTVKTIQQHKRPTGIGSWRGSQTYTSIPSDIARPLLPIIHPAAILREYTEKNITEHDLRARAGRFLRGQLEWPVPELTSAIFKPTFDQLVEAFASWRKQLAAGPLDLSIDIETYVKSWISVVGLADATVELCIPFFYFQNYELVSYWTVEEEQWIWGQLKFILEHPNCRIIGQNFMYDTQFFKRGYDVDAIVHTDTSMLHHLLYPGTPKDLSRLASLYCHAYCYWKDESQDWNASAISAEDMWKYNCKDLRYTYEIAMLLRQLVKSAGMEDLLHEKKCQWRLARKMMLQGIRVDKDEKNRMLRTLIQDSAEVERNLLNCVPEQFRYVASGKPYYSSPQGLMWLLYDRLGLEGKKHKKTKRPTSDDGALQALSEKYPFLSAMLDSVKDYRSIQVFRKHFLEARLGPDGRLRCQFTIHGPETHRWSSSENGFEEGTNLQNVPKIED
jgi:uracil-DNA glycosylase